MTGEIVRQASEYLDVHQKRIYVLVKEGRIEKRIADYWLFTNEELHAYNQEPAERPKGGRPRKKAQFKCLT